MYIHLLSHWKAMAQSKYYNKRWKKEGRNKKQRSNGKCSFQNETLSPGSLRCQNLNPRRAWLGNFGLKHIWRWLSVWLHVTYIPQVWRKKKIPAQRCLNTTFYSAGLLSLLLSNFLFPITSPKITLFSVDPQVLSLQHPIWDTSPFNPPSIIMQVLFPVCLK